MPSFAEFRDKANRLLSGTRLAWDQIKALPQTTANVSDAMQSIPGLKDIQATPDKWDVEGSLRTAKDRLMGFYRGYVAPALR